MTGHERIDSSTEPPPPDRARDLRAERTLLLAATLLALGLRIWLAVRSEVWLDEANSVLIALAPVRDLAATLAPDSSPPLYYLLLKLWAWVAPIDPFWLRVPSIVFGCAAVPAISAVGRAMDRPRTGLIAAWLLALDPLHAYYSEEVRMYSMLVLLALALYYAVFHLLRRTGAVAPAILAGTALAYTHYYGLVFVGAVFIVALVVLRGRRLRALACGFAVGVAFLPWLPVFLAQLANSGQVGWIRDFWELYPGAFGIVRSAQAFMPGGMKYPFVPLRGIGSQDVILAVGALPFLVLASRRERWRLLAPLGLPSLVVGVTLAVLVIRSYVGEPIYLAGRSDVVVLPLFLLALALALARIGPRTQILFVAVWATLSLSELAGSWEALRKPGDVGIADAVRAAGCETVVAAGLAYAPVLFYQMLDEDGARVVPYPVDVGEHPGNLDAALYSPARLAAEASVLAERFPPRPGTCLLTQATGRPDPLADAYATTGVASAVSEPLHLSLMPGTEYRLVSFEHAGP